MLKFIPERLFQNAFKLNFLQAIIILSFSSILNGQERMIITGKVVDDKGNPVNNATVELLPHCKNCPLDLIEIFLSDENGNFAAFLDSKTKYFLFIEEEKPLTHKNLIMSPSGQIGYLSRYRTLVYYRKSEAVNIGNVKPTIQYVKTELDLQKFVGDKAIESSERSRIRIQTKDYKGKVVSNKSSIEEKFWADSSKIKIALPKGTWILDIFMDEDEKEKKIGSIKLVLESETNVKKSILS